MIASIFITIGRATENVKYITESRVVLLEIRESCN